MEEKRFRDWIKEIDWAGHYPFILMHLSCLFVIFVGVSPAAIVICLIAVAVRMFGITGGYHRYFSHRSFETSRFFQFCLAFLGASSTQNGPLWWAQHHRHHHRHSDKEKDVHSPIIDTFLWSHIGWIMAKSSYEGDHFSKIPDLAKYPELRWIDRHYKVAGIALMLMIMGVGLFVERVYPHWGASFGQILVWGFFVSTVILYHMTFAINSFTHLWGTRRYDTNDDSRNNFLLALITMGEGWHNNHHKHCGTVRMGFFWWEIDATYYILKFLSLFHIVWNLKPPPKEAYALSK